MDSLELGRFIQSRRKDLGMTQAELGAKINVTDKAISRWERGVPKLNDTTLKPTLTLLLNNTILEVKLYETPYILRI